jgi:hypothetical protein
MIAIVALLGALLAADAATYDLSGRAEARETSTSPGQPTSVNARMLQLDLVADANLQTGQWLWTAAYQPRILSFAPDQAGLNGFTGFNTATLGVQYRISPTGRMRLSETASYGTQDNSPLNASLPGLSPAQQLLNENPRLPLVEILATISSSSQLAYTQQLSQDVTASADASYSLGGGADALARDFLPFQHSTSGDGSLAWQATAHDRLSLSLGATGTNFPGGSRSRITSASLAWSSQLGVGTTFALSGGGGLGHSVGNGQPTGWQPAFSGSASLATSIVEGDQPVSLSLRVGVSTVIDPLGAGFFELGDAHVGLGWQLTRNLSLVASGGGGRALTGNAQEGQTVSVFDGEVAYRIGPDLGIEGGARGSWQALPPGTIGGTAGLQWAAFAALSFADRGHF